VAQFFQQLLAVATLTQIEIAQDEIVGLLLHLKNGLGGIGGQLHPGDPEVGERQPQCIAHAGVVLHHQRTQGAVINECLAGRSRVHA